MKLSRIFSLSLALALQVMPLTRLFVVATPAAGSSFAIIAMWLGGAAALLGSVDAVSGASSISISPATATTGVPYSGIVQYSGAHASSAKSWQLKNNWNGAQTGCNTAYEIAPGLWLTNAATYLVRVGGTPTASGTFSFTVKIFDGSNCGGGNSDTRTASITISAGSGAVAPSITTQPASQTVTAGNNASFSVVAGGTAPLSYQWRQSGTNVGANSATLALTSVTVGQAGNYTVVVTNSAGSVTSSVAVLTVNPAPVAPSITTQPVSQTVTAGNNVNFSVVAGGTAPLSYQWRQSGTNVGVNSATLALTSVTVGQAGNYTVVVTNVAGSVTSSVATLTVNVPATAPSITTQPVSQTVIVGGNASFSVLAGGTGPLSYQWWQNGTNVGANSATLALTSVAVGQAGNYIVVVTNSVGSVTSSVAALTVNVAPSITTQPLGQTVTAGSNVNFSVLAGGTAPLSYQWKQNGTNVGVNSASLALTSVTVGQAGNYTVVVTNVAGSTTSSVAALTVNSAPVAPSITTQPLSQTVTAGSNVNFSVFAGGTAPLSYQWRQNGTNVGANNATLALTSVTVGQAGSYTVVVTNSLGSVTSSVATLTVNPAPVLPSITTQPLSQTVTVGSNANFSVFAGGTAPLNYQWRQNGTNVGANSATLALTSVTIGQAGNYTVVVTNIAGAVTSSVATLTVSVPATPPSITTQPVGQTVFVGGSANFIVLAAGTGPLSYQWWQDGTNVAGANTPVLALTNVTIGQAGGYLVVITNSVGSVTSSVAMLTVDPVPETDIIRPTVAITSPAAGVVVNPSVTILGVAADDSGVKTVWYSINGGPFNNATGSADWSAWGTPWPVLLVSGTNVLRAYSEDLAGNVSLTNTVIVIYNPTDALTLSINGGGRVTGATNGQRIKLGSLLKLKATPSAGSIFSNWVGMVYGSLASVSSSPTLAVPMVPGLAITANFVPNPFTTVVGQFNGLFYETNGVKVGTCGSFSLKVTALGAYTGVILNDGRRTSVSGRFNAGGKATNVVTLSGGNAFSVAWCLDFGGSDQITGTIDAGNWSAELSGDRAVFNTRTNPCSYAGKYTFVLPGTPGATLVPEGNSYGTVTIDSNGVAKLSGYLADKTSIAQIVPVSKNGEWPLYSPRPARKGVLIAWISLADRPTDDFSGQSVWLMPPQDKAAYYPSGFAYAQTLVGSHYTPPVGAGARVLALTNAIARLSGGNLSGSFTNEIVFGPGSKVIEAYPNEFTAVFTPASGLFRGTFTPGADVAKVALSGVAFQKTTNAFGYVTGKSKSGRLMLEAGTLP